MILVMAPLKPVSLLLILTIALVAEHDRFGLPACSGPGLELADRSYFVLCHSSDRKVRCGSVTSSHPST
jgi:hypothetical protein